MINKTWGESKQSGKSDLFLQTMQRMNHFSEEKNQYFAFYDFYGLIVLSIS